MPCTSNGPGGPLTELLKEAGLITGALSTAGKAVAGLGKGIWGAAGHFAPHPLARAGLLSATAVGVGTQVPQLAGRISQDASYTRGESPSPRGF